MPKMIRGGLICLLVIMIPLSWRRAAAPVEAQAGQARIPGVQYVAATTVPSVAATPTAEPVRGRPPLSLTLMLVLTGCSVGGVIAVLAVGAIASMRVRKEGSKRVEK